MFPTIHLLSVLSYLYNICILTSFSALTATLQRLRRFIFLGLLTCTIILPVEMIHHPLITLVLLSIN